MNPYDPTSIEQKWQQRWEEARIFDFDLKKAKDPYYCLVMFPYPSGARLHVGHWFQYSIPDSFARFQRMRGKDVFFPVGFDAFGLPSENFAIKSGIPPSESTNSNVQNMIVQYKRMGVIYDWKYMLDTSTPSYYRWTQWLFLQMYKHNLAYKKNAPVNFCPSCQTVLANEQAQDGTCERCGTTVIQKPLEQWFWNITKYADRLLQGLNGLDWPEKTKTMQRNWIGKSEGAEITFDLEGHSEKLTVFTTRPDTLFGATYVVIAPEHPLVKIITPKSHWSKVKSYIESVAKKSEMERTELTKTKTGEFTGAFALNPATGKQVPIWIADYVLMTYGTGAIMAVPSHDERDFDFALYHDLPIKCVMDPQRNIVNFNNYIHPRFANMGDERERDNDAYSSILKNEKCWTGPGKATNSGFLDGLDVEAAKDRMIVWLENEGRGKAITTYRLRDWLVSRQRYWGAPIPIVYDPEGKPHPIPEEHLPWMLPTDVEFKPKGKSPLTESKEFIARTEKIFGKGWKPEFDTMDTFVCSSFYFLRFLAEGSDKSLISSSIEQKWMPVDFYIGGPEHACMHLIYARFVMMALKDFGLVSHEEPFQKLIHQGLVTNQGAKMSKSKGNVVSPDAFVEKYGSDVFRMYLMFMGPFTQGGDWSDTGIKGVARFVQRIWRVFGEKLGKVEADAAEVTRKLHQTIKKVGGDIERLHFNTALSALMELFNVLEKADGITTETGKICARLIAPLAPHLAEEMWEHAHVIPNSSSRAKSRDEGFVVNQKWPSFDAAHFVSDTVVIVVQVNGKVRASIEVPSAITEKDAIATAKEHENVQKYIAEKTIRKEIYIPGKLVSLVV